MVTTSEALKEGVRVGCLLFTPQLKGFEQIIHFYIDLGGADFH
jgi:hypothetical protein